MSQHQQTPERVTPERVTPERVEVIDLTESPLMEWKSPQTNFDWICRQLFKTWEVLPIIVITSETGKNNMVLLSENGEEVCAEDEEDRVNTDVVSISSDDELQPSQCNTKYDPFKYPSTDEDFEPPKKKRRNSRDER